MASTHVVVLCILSVVIASAAPPVRDIKNNPGAVDKHFLGFPGTGMGYPGMGMGYPGMGMGYPGMGMGYPGVGMGMGMGYPGFGYSGGFYGGYPGYMGIGYPMGGYPGGGIMFYNKGKAGNKTPSLQKH